MTTKKRQTNKEKQDALLRMIITDPSLNEALYLVRNGVPFDVAFSLSAEERFSWSVIMGRFDGHKFNFKTMKFENP